MVDAAISALAAAICARLEQTYQLLHQVRRNRAAPPPSGQGRVLIQTFMPDQPVMRALAANDRTTASWKPRRRSGWATRICRRSGGWPR